MNQDFSDYRGGPVQVVAMRRRCLGSAFLLLFDLIVIVDSHISLVSLDFLLDCLDINIQTRRLAVAQKRLDYIGSKDVVRPPKIDNSDYFKLNRTGALAN